MPGIGSTLSALSGIAAGAPPLATQSYAFESFQASGKRTYGQGIDNRSEMASFWLPGGKPRGFRLYLNGEFKAAFTYLQAIRKARVWPRASTTWANSLGRCK